MIKYIKFLYFFLIDCYCSDPKYQHDTYYFRNRHNLNHSHLHLSNDQANLNNECELILKKHENFKRKRSFPKDDLDSANKIIIISDEIIVNDFNGFTQQQKPSSYHANFITQETDDMKSIYLKKANPLNDTHNLFEGNLANYGKSNSYSTKDKFFKANSNNRKLKSEKRNLDRKKKLLMINMSQKNAFRQILSVFSRKNIFIDSKNNYSIDILIKKMFKINVDSEKLFNCINLKKIKTDSEFIFPLKISLKTIIPKFDGINLLIKELLVDNNNIAKDTDFTNFYHEVEFCCESLNKEYCNIKIFEGIFKIKKYTFDLVWNDFMLFADNRNDIENVKSEIKNFYLDNEYYDFLMLEKFNNYIFNVKYMIIKILNKNLYLV
ncbi:hypothetical protein GVAV_002603 [Gurleya vavrai]